MKISASQTQLLRQLNIKPLQARAAFFPELVVQPEHLPTATAQLLQPDDCLLCNDIKLMLGQTAISNWLLDPAANQCVLTDNESVLITPDLTALQQAELKRQLWTLLQQQLSDHVD
ncbi:hypothetical protein WG68_09130 [Arsukibacterium ikkense]|uniref:Uncharacterized protein n=1 Tax=Arsukibacterium ikkense TaxID=336831 RepID=A0A0M2V3W1_9GAMM|nr:hypothetical protein [Arsukibacterium ikkense]KKO45542.1 hypothetical protein WG68_09130 [Arsukibacterium ikkense]